MINFKDNKNKSPLNTRWAQMTKQEQIIERKKMEIQAKLEAQKQAAALAAQAKLSNPSTSEESGKTNIFSNDGSFMSQFKALLEKQKQETEEKEQKEREQKSEEEAKESKEVQSRSEDSYEKEYHNEDRRRSNDRGQREKQRRWNERGRNRQNSPNEERKKHGENKNAGNIPPLMQIPVMPPDDVQDSDQERDEWPPRQSESPDSSQDQNYPPSGSGPLEPNPMPPGTMPPGMMGPGMLGPPNMGPGPLMGHGPMMGPGGPNMPPGPMPPFMGGPPNFNMPPNFMGPNRPGGPMPPNMCGPNGPMSPFFRPPFPNQRMMGPNGQPNPMGGPPNSMMGPNGPINPMMGPNGPPNQMMGPNGPPNQMMGPNGPPNSMIGPNGPPNSMIGPNGPPNSMMGPNVPPNQMMGPNGPPNSMMGPNGPPNSMMGPNGPPSSMMGPNGPPNSMMGPNGPPNSIMGPNGPPNSIMGPNGPPNPMMGPNGPPNMMGQNPNMMGPNGPPNSMGGGPPNNGNMHFMGPRPPFGPNGPRFGSGNGPPFRPPHSMADMPAMDPGAMPPMHMMKNKDIPGQLSQVLTDSFPPSIVAAATEVATNGDQWENALKSIHSQDLWFLHNPSSNEYKAFRDLVLKLRQEKEKKPEVKDEDKYEPEFSLEDDDSNDEKPHFKQEHSNSNKDYWNQNTKREHASSQSDDDSDTKREKRRRKKKSRWGDEPPVVDIKPPGVLQPLPTGIVPGPKLAKIDEDGLKLTNVNRNNQALMQYAMTNYGTTNLSAEDWKKCEDNFKLNLLYQDMLKKRQEVERLAAAGKHKYEYDSDEDTSEGTWEHKLRAREMNATEKWADELTKQAAGKHHIGDFLPPEELKKFMEKYSAVKSGKEPDLSDYKEFKLKEDNVGFKMLQKLGWNEGQGLGAEGGGIVEPINKANQPVANLGLGASTSDVVAPEDDEFDAYRKRMMLAYRFRPNPLNNPRRPYY